MTELQFLGLTVPLSDANITGMLFLSVPLNLTYKRVSNALKAIFLMKINLTQFKTDNQITLNKHC